MRHAPRTEFAPLWVRSSTATVTIPAAGSGAAGVVASGFRLPGIGLTDTPTNAMGPELTLCVVATALPGLFPGDPTMILDQRLWVSERQLISPPSVLAASLTGPQSAFSIRLPVPPECTIEARVIAAATLTGNPEQVTVHYKAYVLAADVAFRQPLPGGEWTA